MMVTVTAFKKMPGHSEVGCEWMAVKRVECAEKDAPIYVKMFFDEGFEKVRVG